MGEEGYGCSGEAGDWVLQTFWGVFWGASGEYCRKFVRDWMLWLKEIWSRVLEPGELEKRARKFETCSKMRHQEIYKSCEAQQEDNL